MTDGEIEKRLQVVGRWEEGVFIPRGKWRREDAEDAYQDAALALLRFPEKSASPGWVFCVARNAMRQKARRAGVESRAIGLLPPKCGDECSELDRMAAREFLEMPRYQTLKHKYGSTPSQSNGATRKKECRELQRLRLIWID